MINFHDAIYQCLMQTDINKKLSQLQTIQSQWGENCFDFCETETIEKIPDAGRPIKPDLVAPRELPRRRLGSLAGKTALMHSIAHIEFNAINLALDALYRFQKLPKQFYKDWLGVALEEAFHFQMIREHLESMGSFYGDLPAHDGLWISTYETDYDPLVRMALVPRTLEARGLDVTPAMITKLRSVGDKRGVEILKILLRDEIGHVEVGTRWFRYFCNQQKLNPFDTFTKLIETHFHGDIRGPFNYEAREQAGFCEQEINWLKQMEKK